MKVGSALDSLQQGILICNKEGLILYFNDVYAKYLGKTLEEVRGRKISGFRKHSVVMDVIRSGIPREGMAKQENGQFYYASVYPIIENEKITGSISIVTSIFQSHHSDTSSRTLRERVREFEREEILLSIARHGEDVDGKRAAADELGISLATLYNKLSDAAASKRMGN